LLRIIIFCVIGGRTPEPLLYVEARLEAVSGEVIIFSGFMVGKGKKCGEKRNDRAGVN